MPDPVAILLLPWEGDPGGLNRRQLGSVPPEVWLEPGGTWSEPWDPYDTDGTEPVAPKARALPLWWDGALVPEGWDRLLRRIDTDDSDRAPRHPTADEVIEMVRYTLAYQRIASRVVLLDRIDGRLVERP